MIVRDPEAAQGQRFDIIVIGGGIYGCTLTLEAARKGLRPLLVERDDFGQHTSSNWLRILHGGLRYLQRLDLRRHYESVMERRWFLANFPELVEPLRCVMPLYAEGLRRRPVMAGALRLNDLLSPYRNRGVREDRRIPSGRIVSVSQVTRMFPGIDPEGIRGGAVWYDAVAHRPQRVLMEVLRWGVMRGATVLNYVEARDLLSDGSVVRGVRARDSATGQNLEFHAPVVVNCGGPWSEQLAFQLHGKQVDLFRPSLALNVLFDRKADFQGALAATARRSGARTYFFQSSAGKILAGTYHSPLEKGPSEEGPEAGVVDAFVDELNEAVPWLRLSSSHVLRVFQGELPVSRTGTVDLALRDVIHDHGAHGGPKGLFSVSGVKYTVARRIAVRTLSLIHRRGLVSTLSSANDTPPGPWLPPSRSEMEGMVVESPAAAREVVETLVSQEAVLLPDDLLLRRTDWGEVSPPSEPLGNMVRQVLSSPPRKTAP